MSYKVRQSNFELLRIVAMFMVMMLHVNFLALGKPSVEDTGSAPLATFTRILFEVMSVGSVDLFVLISGWFGIKANRKSLFTFIFQVVFVIYSVSIVCLLLNKDNSLGGGKIVEIITCRSWFVQAYLGLYLLSPALNLLVEKSKHLHKMMLIGWLSFEFVYDFASPDPRLFDGGYSTLHFVALYLLARYIKLYGVSNILRKYAGSLFVLVSLFVAGCYVHAHKNRTWSLPSQFIHQPICYVPCHHASYKDRQHSYSKQSCKSHRSGIVCCVSCSHTHPCVRDLLLNMG